MKPYIRIWIETLRVTRRLHILTHTFDYVISKLWRSYLAQQGQLKLKNCPRLFELCTCIFRHVSAGHFEWEAHHWHPAVSQNSNHSNQCIFPPTNYMAFRIKRYFFSPDKMNTIKRHLTQFTCETSASLLKKQSDWINYLRSFSTLIYLSFYYF